MATLSIAQTVNKMKIGGADKVALTSLLTGLANDLETLRGKQAALAAKLDADAGVTDTNFVTLIAIPAGGLSVGK